MIGTDKLKFARIVVVAVACLLAIGCKSNGSKVPYVVADLLPVSVAVPLPILVGDVSMSPDKMHLLQEVFRNYLVGMDYTLVSPDQIKECKPIINTSEPERSVVTLVDCLAQSGVKADGVALITVTEFQSINVGLVDYNTLNANVTVFDSFGKELGIWENNTKRQKVSVTIDPLGAVISIAAGIVGSMTNDVHQRDVIYDWAYNITAQMPSLSQSKKVPKIFRVVTNTGNTIFKDGDQIALGFEGDKGLNAYFDIGEFKKNIPISEIEPGVYMGSYGVKQNDHAEREPILVHYAAINGGVHTWPVMEPLVTIDAELPKALEQFKATVHENDVLLSWQTTDPDIVSVIVQRSMDPLTNYSEVARISNFEWRDENIVAGQTYYYRVSSQDSAGNLSFPLQSEAQTIPIHGLQVLSDPLTGKLSAGTYLLESTAYVPANQYLEIKPGVIISISPGARLIVIGNLIGEGVKFSAVNPDQDEVAPTSALPAAELVELEYKWWDGIVVEQGGSVQLSDATFRDCGTCITIRGKADINGGHIQDSSNGVFIQTLENVRISGGRFDRLDKAVSVNEGNLDLEQVTLSENGIGIEVTGGVINMTNSNLYNNTINIKTSIPFVLENNYMGGQLPNDIGVHGHVIVRSLLDAPWPNGIPVVMDNDELDIKAQKNKELGITAFREQRYGQAYDYLKKALGYKEMGDTRLYLAYVLSAVNKDEELETLLEDAMIKYPNDVRFYNLAVRSYIANNKIVEANNVLDRGLQLNPGSPKLEELRTFIGE